jgi:hypothetical protein
LDLNNDYKNDPDIVPNKKENDRKIESISPSNNNSENTETIRFNLNPIK